MAAAVQQSVCDSPCASYRSGRTVLTRAMVDLGGLLCCCRPSCCVFINVAHTVACSAAQCSAQSLLLAAPPNHTPTAAFLQHPTPTDNTSVLPRPRCCYVHLGSTTCPVQLNKAPTPTHAAVQCQVPVETAASFVADYFLFMYG